MTITLRFFRFDHLKKRADESRFLPIRKQLVWSAIAASIIAFGNFQFTPAQAHVLKQSQWRCNGLVFTKTNSNWKGEDSATIEVRKNGKLLLRRQAHDAWLWTIKNGDFVECEEHDRFETTDLNGDGIKDFVIRQWSGGAYCCYTYEVFSMANNCRRLWFDDAKCAHLKILFKNKPAVLAMEDGSFLYWRTYSLDGPRPVVYLTWRQNTNNEKPILDKKRMLRPIDSTKFSRLKSAPLNEEKERMFIDLVYSGHSDAALNLIANVSAQDRKEFVDSFVQALKSGPFYFKIVGLNGPKFANLTGKKFE